MLKINGKLNKGNAILRRIVTVVLCVSLIIGIAPLTFLPQVHAAEAYDVSNGDERNLVKSVETNFARMIRMSEPEREEFVDRLAYEVIHSVDTEIVTDTDLIAAYDRNSERIGRNVGWNHTLFPGNTLLIKTRRYIAGDPEYYPITLDDFRTFATTYVSFKASAAWEDKDFEEKKAIIEHSVSNGDKDYMPDPKDSKLKLYGYVRDYMPEVNYYWGGYECLEQVNYSVHASKLEIDYYRFTKDPENAIIATDINDTYILRTDTGVLGGNNVLYLGIKYTDVNGVDRTEFLFPHESSLNDGFRIAEFYGSPSQKLRDIFAATDYKVTNSYGNTDGLLPYSSDMYLFQPGYKMQSFNGIDVFMRYPMDGKYTKGWTCTGMYMYKVDQLYGVQMAGYYSGSYNIAFKGSLLGYLEEDAIDFELEGSDIMYKVSNKAGSDYKFAVPSAEAAVYDSKNSEFLVKFDIADVYGAGIESLAANYNDGYRLKQVAEALAVNITYKDVYGRSKTVVMPAITSMIGWMVEKGMVETELPIAGVAQQGDPIMFPASLPDFESLVGVSVTYGDEAAAAAGVEATAGVTRNQRLKGLANDEMAITGMQIYGSDVTVNYALDGASVRLSANGDPLYYFVANESSGKQIRTGKTELPMSKYMQGASLKPVDQIGESHYILVIKTDDMNQAGTTAHLTARVGYEFTDGKTYETKAIDLTEAAEDFFGYWPCADGKSAAAAAASPGMELIAELPITHANKFTSVTISMDSRSTDDWQMKELAIYSVDSTGNRRVVWNKPEEGDAKGQAFLKISDRYITRDFERSDDSLVARYPSLLDIAETEDEDEMEKIYLGGNIFTQTIFFGENSKSDIEKRQSVDWDKIRYSMSYKETMQDLGFSTRDSVYQVDVKVASNSESNSNDGDCGSQNLFYFKLIFENGSSGYVLANQQLSADGFRADRTETFYIATNEDKGALTAVSIISEDNSGNTNHDVFDKLKISYIDVIKVSDEALSKSWRIDNVGWIDINYLDKGAEEGSTGRPGRTEAELAQVKTVTSKGYSVNLLFVLNTGSYARGENDTNIGASKNNPQFQGSAVATIEYYDSTGSLRKKSIDMVSAMYEYASRKPETYSELFKDTEDVTVNRARSNDEFMFRANHNDRFIVSLNDVKQIVRVRFGMRSEVSTTWKLNKVSVYKINSSGNLQLTTADEYKRTNELEFLCESKDDIGYKLKVFAPERVTDTLGEEQSLPVLFTDHSLNININGSKWSSSITKKPENKNDSLNVYVYMKNNPEGSTPLTDFDLKANVQWHTNIGDGDRADSIGPLNKDIKNNMFYYVGLRTNGLDTVKSISIKGSSRNLILADLDHVIIQHVRSGVTIETYYADFTGVSAEYEHNSVCIPVQQVEGNIFAQSQTAGLFFGPGTEEFELIKDKQDVAVAISYKTSNDYRGAGDANSETLGYVYRSAYVMLSELIDDSGNLLYPTIKSGTIVEVPFEEPFVKEITGMTLVAIGDINVNIDSAYVAKKNSSGKVEDWTSFGIGSDILGVPFNATPTEYQAVTPLKFTFETNTDARIVSSDNDNGNDAPIRMVIDYTDLATGGRNQMVIGDIRNYLTSGDFKVTEKDGKISNTATIELFGRNVGSIRSIKLEPYSGKLYSSAVWGITSVYGETNAKGSIKSGSVTLMHEEYVNGVRTQVPGKTAAEGTPLAVNMSSVYEILNVSYYDSVLGITNKPQSEINGTVTVAVPKSTTFTITPLIAGTMDGYGFTADVMQLVNGVLVPAKGATITSDKITFTPPENTSTDAVTYVITCYSEEFPSVSASAQITIAGQAAPAPEKEKESKPEPTPTPAPQQEESQQQTPDSTPEPAPETDSN